MSKIKVLGVCGSPRVKGNVEKLVDEALKAAMETEEVETELIRLSGKKITPCQGCMYKCREEKKCIIDDDMQEIYGKLKDSDGIVLGTPVHFWTVSGQLKVFMDRTIPLSWSGALRNKIGGGIALGAGIYGGQELALQTINNFFLVHGIIPVLWVRHSDLGAAATRKHLEDGTEVARSLGKKVVELVKHKKV